MKPLWSGHPIVPFAVLPPLLLLLLLHHPAPGAMSSSAGEAVATQQPLRSAAPASLVSAGASAAKSRAGSLRHAPPDSVTLLQLTCEVRDTQSGDLIPARCTVTDADGEPRFPCPPDTCYYHAPSWAHDGYFYSRGVFCVEVPAGATVVGVGRGFEYYPARLTVDVRSDTCIVFELHRHVTMSDLGWYSGDTHTHIRHCPIVYDLVPEDVLGIADAEGLNVVCCLDNDYRFTGGPAPCSTPLCVVYMTEEQRSSVFGHSACLGLSSLVQPTSSRWWPLVMDVADAVHSQPGTAFIAAHPVSTDDFFDLDSVSGRMLARELPVDAVHERIDGYEVLSYSNVCDQDLVLSMWYGLLNCGHRLVAVGATDACVDRLYDRPPGGFRTYVRIPTGDFDYNTWSQSLLAGRTFVTNGPLFTGITVEGLAPGGLLESSGVDSLALSGSFSVTSQFPISRAEIIVNGAVDQAVYFPPNTLAAKREFIVSIHRSSWVAVRISGESGNWFTQGNCPFAHSGPIYFELDGERVIETESAEFFVQWISDLSTLCEEQGEWDDPADSLRVVTELEGAINFYEALALGMATELREDQEAALAGRSGVVACCRPNPVSGGALIDLVLTASGPLEIGVYTVAGRRVTTPFSGELAAGRHTLTWDAKDSSGRPLASGVYFLFVKTDDRVETQKVAVVR